MHPKHAGLKPFLRYRGRSALHTGNILIMFGLVILIMGGYVSGIIIITVGAVITLDYFLVQACIRQTSLHPKHRARHPS